MRGKSNGKTKSRKSKIEPLYEVEKITNKKIEDGKVKYLVKWEGYPETDSK